MASHLFIDSATLYDSVDCFDQSMLENVIDY